MRIIFLVVINCAVYVKNNAANAGYSINGND